MKKYEFIEDFEGNKKGDVIEQDMKLYHKLQHPLLMKGILKETGKKINKKEKVKEEVNLDLNNDGKVDKKDATIAGKVLANQRKINKGDK